MFWEGERMRERDRRDGVEDRGDGVEEGSEEGDQQLAA